MPTMKEIQAAYMALLRMPAHEAARAIHCQRAMCVLRDIIAWSEQRAPEDVQECYEQAATVAN